MSRLSKRHFWEWFKRNHLSYMQLNRMSKKEAGFWINELNTHLRAYGKYYSFHLMVSDQQTATLIISVDGNPNRFKRADAFIDMAPVMEGWTFLSLEPPMFNDYIMEAKLSASGIGLDELFFSWDEGSNNHYHITVYHQLCTEYNDESFYNLAHTVVYNLLGERSFGMDIGSVDVANLSESGKAQLWKLEELPAIINSQRSLFVVNEAGVLKQIPDNDRQGRKY